MNAAPKSGYFHKGLGFRVQGEVTIIARAVIVVVVRLATMIKIVIVVIVVIIFSLGQEPIGDIQVEIFGLLG